MLSHITKYKIVLSGVLLILGSAVLTAASTAEQPVAVERDAVENVQLRPMADLINQGNFPVSVDPSDSVSDADITNSECCAELVKIAVYTSLLFISLK